MIPHNRSTVGIEEEAAALRVLRSGWLGQGREVESFENEFCQFFGLPERHAVAVSSGTAALFMALNALHAHGKRVAFPAYVCSSLRHATALAQGHEVLIDITNDGPNVDLKALASCGAEVAIVPHMYGLPVDLSPVQNVAVIEDCCHSLGASVRGVPTGLQGKIGIFSFYSTKLMTSGGQGGMLISKDSALIEAVRDYREFDARHDSRTRFNFQMTDVQAAIGRAQLQKYPAFLKRRQEIFNRYVDSGLKLLDVPVLEGSQLCATRFRAIIKTKSAAKIITNMKEKGIRCAVPLEDWQVMGAAEKFPHSIKMAQQTVSIPLYPSLSDEEVNTVINSLKGCHDFG